MKPEEIITDEQLNEAWGNAYFGKGRTKRDILRYGLLKSTCLFHNGSICQSIITKLGLVTGNNAITEKGRKYLWAAFGRSGM